ncbi:hypothetical protein [Streptomyces atroolivaceus]|uniref:hypothetical protein n=1 Tax=Streptomyces atroolivaceus TaxID=66869 RepID=UPI002024228A|nr:hypothetical protein [Streptomyces atroolivaceus]
MPTWITPRRLGAAATLYAVFVSGWYLGQPLSDAGCFTQESTVASDGPETIQEPGDVSSHLTVTARQVFTAEIVSTEGLVRCDGTPRPRLVAWVTGNWS